MPPDSTEHGTPPVEPGNVISKELMDIYLAAEYVVHIQGGDIVLKIGELAPATLGSHPWSLITAHNPYSRPLCATDNQALQQSLVDMLAAHSYRTLPATGRSADGQWQEASLLVLNISRDLARALGGRFRQNAVVFAEAGGPVELLLCDTTQAVESGVKSTGSGLEL